MLESVSAPMARERGELDTVGGATSIEASKHFLLGQRHKVGRVEVEALCNEVGTRKRRHQLAVEMRCDGEFWVWLD